MPTTTDTAAPLTPRQAEIVALLAGGLTAKQAARRIGIAIGTADLHLHLARRRTGCKTTAELVAKAIQGGWV